MRTNKIEKSLYTGYLWKSDSPHPEVLIPAQEYEYAPVDSENPFIIEGFLYDEDNHISYSIKSVDGECFIHRYDLNTFNNVEKREKKYLAHPNIGNNIKLKFDQYWRPEPDERCEEISVLKPAEFVFTGFQKVIIKSDSQK